MGDTKALVERIAGTLAAADVNLGTRQEAKAHCVKLIDEATADLRAQLAERDAQLAEADRKNKRLLNCLEDTSCFIQDSKTRGETSDTCSAWCVRRIQTTIQSLSTVTSEENDHGDF